MQRCEQTRHTTENRGNTHFYCYRGNTVLGGALVALASAGRLFRRLRRLHRRSVPARCTKESHTYLGNIGPRGIVR